MSNEREPVIPMGSVKLNGREMDVVMRQPDLPTDEQARDVCARHIFQQGKGSEMMDEFWMGGCDFPEQDVADPTITIQLSCNGLSRFRKKCRLTLTQFGENDKVLNKGNIVSG